MNYVLKHCDTPLVGFSASGGAEFNVEIVWFNESALALLPLEFHGVTTAGNLTAWLCHRTIPRNRAYMEVLLSSQGLSPNRPMDVIRLSKGLSLNDCYWVVEDGFDGAFSAFNLYGNRFSRVQGAAGRQLAHGF